MEKRHEARQLNPLIGQCRKDTLENTFLFLSSLSYAMGSHHRDDGLPLMVANAIAALKFEVRNEPAIH